MDQHQCIYFASQRLLYRHGQSPCRLVCARVGLASLSELDIDNEVNIHSWFDWILIAIDEFLQKKTLALFISCSIHRKDTRLDRIRIHARLILGRQLVNV